MSAVTDLELHKEDLKRKVRLAEAAEKLQNNREFKLLINEHYLLEQTARWMMNSTNPEYNATFQADFVERARAASRFKHFMGDVQAVGRQARHGLDEIDTHIEHARQEELAEIQGDVA